MYSHCQCTSQRHRYMCSQQMCHLIPYGSVVTLTGLLYGKNLGNKLCTYDALGHIFYAIINEMYKFLVWLSWFLDVVASRPLSPAIPLSFSFYSIFLFFLLLQHLQKATHKTCRNTLIFCFFLFPTMFFT